MTDIAGIDARKLARMNDRERRRQLEARVYEKMDEISPVSEQPKDSSFFGKTPPALFIGRHGYPKVNAGVLSPVKADNPDQFDSPPGWYQDNAPVETVMAYRTSLVNSRDKVSIDRTERFAQSAQEIAMASDPVDIEVNLNKTPSFNISMPQGATPYGPSEQVNKLELAENPSIARAVDKAVSDDDWKAANAAEYLYSKDLDVYKIQKVLSAGLLGKEDRRKLVPTRWSITATDDTLGKGLRKDVKTSQQLGEYRLFKKSYNGNHFTILLIPGNWEFELIEIKGAGSVWNPSSDAYLKSNHEPYKGRTSYATETAGAYYAARLGVLEYLNKINRQAKAIVLRTVTDQYWAPLGVWVIRETVRNAMEEYSEASSIEQLEEQFYSHATVPEKEIQQVSKMLEGTQQALDSFT